MVIGCTLMMRYLLGGASLSPHYLRSLQLHGPQRAVPMPLRATRALLSECTARSFPSRRASEIHTRSPLLS